MKNREKCVGFLGLGTMGAPMARNLIAKGFAVRGYNRTRAKAEAVAGLAAVCDTPREAVAGCSIVVSCVSDGPDVADIHLGADGTIAGVGERTEAGAVVVVDCSTIAAETARHVHAALGERGIAFVDAPMSGGQKGANDGTLSFFVGGAAEALEQARPALEAMGKRVTLLGPSGAGQLGKAVNQIIVAANLLAASEGLAFAARAGLPLPALHEALTGGAANSWALDVLGKKMIARDFLPAFAIKHQLKDLGIVLETAREQGSPVFGAALVHQLLGILEAQDKGELGTQALFALYESLSRQ